MLQCFVSWYVKCVEKVPFCKPGHYIEMLKSQDILLYILSPVNI